MEYTSKPAVITDFLFYQVGTLDVLLSVSDDLSRLDSYTEE